jgi:amino acid adenylation domain-containing protein
MKADSILPASVEEKVQDDEVLAFPLSYAQQRLWFIDQMEHESSVYNVPQAYRLKGSLDINALQAAIDALVRRHEALRTTFAMVNDETAQVVAPAVSIKLDLLDLTDVAEEKREKEALRLASEESERPFDLTTGPLLRVVLYRLSERQHVLLVLMHHIITDEWSMAIFVRELAALYAAFLEGKPSPLAELALQYADYAVWQRDWLQGERLEKQLAYWKRQLEGLTVLELPTDRQRPAMQTYRGEQVGLNVSRELTNRLKALSRKESVTLFMTLLGAFQVLLHRYSGQEDIAVGTPIANRNRLEIEGIIGFFVNTLVLRSNLRGDPSFRELLGRVREAALGAHAHQDLPFEKLVEELKPERDLSKTPLFQVMFALHNVPSPTLELSGLEIEPLEVKSLTAKFDLLLSMAEEGGELRGELKYNADLFNPDTILRMTGHLKSLLEGITANPEARLSELPLLTAEERRQLLVEWNETRAEYPHDKCIHQLFEEQVERTPDAVALIFENQQLTYRELNTRANQLAHHLRKLGVSPEALVGLFVDRSLNMVVGLLGILKAGGAYVPLDPGYPQERLAFMLEDAHVAVLLTQAHLRAALPANAPHTVCLDTDWEMIADEAETNPPTMVAGGNLAYVIYTSGSTGKPKGVQVLHRAVFNFLSSIRHEFGLDARDGLMAVTTLSFDVASMELFLPLCLGARVILAGRDVARDGRQLGEKLEETGATVLHLTPVTWRMLVESGWQGAGELKMLCGGEALTRSLANELLGRSDWLWNLYGPTETTIWSTMYRVDGEGEVVPIGRPIANTRVYILDAHLQPTPIGVPGELHVGGPGLARGYLNRPDLTADKFIPDPYGGEPGARLYKTGDLARYLPDGNIEFLGRMDDQVKLRGFRIELGEIEAVLRQHPGVQECVVIAREDIPGNKQLVAYFVSKLTERVGPSELRSYLKEKLPEYMAPAAYVELEAFPLTPNGKVDRRNLPDPKSTPNLMESNHQGPMDRYELLLTQIWEKLFGVRHVGVTDDFFQLGGHSLLAARMFAEIEKSCGKRFPLRILFEAPTIRELAALLRKDGWQPSWSSTMLIQPLGSNPPLFCIPGLDMALSFYHLAHDLGVDQPVYTLLSNPTGDRNFFLRIEDEAASYVHEIRAIQPHGPYFLAGWCYGGMVAFEVAQQFQAQGERVALLAMLEAGFGLTGLDLIRRYRRRLRYILHMGRRAQLASVHKRIRKLATTQPSTTLPISENGSIPTSVRASRYIPKAYPGRVTLFRTDEHNQPPFLAPLRGLGELARGGVEVHDIPGKHTTVLLEPNVRVLAEKLNVCLLKARTTHWDSSDKG